MSAVARALAHVEAQATGAPLPAPWRVTVHFHPDRLVDGQPLLARLAAEGVYRSQFETGTSNGGLTAHPGGDRWRWEQRIFGGAYDGAPAADRPKYGSLNHRERPAGGSVRFGSAHLRLAGAILDRATFCYPDSVFEPAAFGTAQRAADLVALADAGEQDLLDDYVEAHVHGPLQLGRDVEAVVLDPAFRDTPVAAAAALLPVAVEWHHGFRLPVAELERHPDYRGPEIVAAGRSIAQDGVLDARVLGEAVAAGRYDRQTLKKVWHCTARFGGLAQEERPT